MLSAMHSTPVSDHANVEAQGCARADQGARTAEFAIRLVMVVSGLAMQSCRQRATKSGPKAL
jgi:hypothetical protein